MKRFFSTVLLTTLAAAATHATAALVIDDFNSTSYSDGTYAGNIIAPSSTAMPWREFGGITSRLTTNTIAAREMDGTQDAITAFSLNASTPQLTVRRNYGTATNLSGYATVTFTVESTAATAGNEIGQVSIADATTQYFSTATFTLSATATTYTFSMAAFGTPSPTTGGDSFPTVLANATEFGFRFTRDAALDSTSDSVAFDNIVLAPEPASIAFLVMGMGVTALRRRRIN